MKKASSGKAGAAAVSSSILGSVNQTAAHEQALINDLQIIPAITVTKANYLAVLVDLLDISPTSPTPTFSKRRQKWKQRHQQYHTEKDRPSISVCLYESLTALLIKHTDLLTQHIKNAIAKPVIHRREGISAVTLLLLTIPASATFSSSHQAKLILPVLRDPQSFINLADLIQSQHTQAEDGEAYTHLIATLITQHIDLLTSTYAPFFQTIIRLSLHKQHLVRQRLLSAVTALLTPTHATLLLPSLLSAFEAILNSKNAETTSPFNYTRCIMLIFGNPLLNDASLPLLSYLASDPLVITSEKAPTALVHKLYKKIVRRTMAQTMDKSTRAANSQQRQVARQLLEFRLRQQADAVSQLIVGQQGLTSDDARKSQTAATLFTALFSFYPTLATSPPILSPVLSLLSSTTLLTLSEYDIAVYRTAEGTLCTVKREGDHLGVVAEHKNIKGRTKEDVEFERLQKEIDKKKGKIDEATKHKIAEQSILRNKISTQVRQVSAICSLISSLASEYSRLTATYLMSSILPRLYPLMSNALVHSQACATHLSLFSVLDHHVTGLSLPLSLCVQLCLTRGDRIWTDRFFSNLIKQNLAALAQRVKREKLSVSTWLYVSPLISAVLLQSHDITANEVVDNEPDTPLEAKLIGKYKEEEDEDHEEEDDHEDDQDDEDGPDKVDSEDAANDGYKPGFADAVSVFLAHCTAQVQSGSSRYPLSHFLSLLLHLLNNTTSQHDRVQNALLCLSPALNIREASVLLGDEGIFSENIDVRQAVLNALSAVIVLKTGQRHDQDLEEPQLIDMLTYRMFVLRFDEKSQGRALIVFNSLHLHITSDYLVHLLPLLGHRFSHIRRAAANAIAAAVESFPQTVAATLSTLLNTFKASSDVVISTGRLGLIRGGSAVPDIQSKWEPRDGVALTIDACTPSFSSADHMQRLFDFFLSHALRDQHETVWSDILSAGLKLITAHGAAHLDHLLPLFTEYTTLKDRADQSEEEHWKNDRVREGSVIFIGTIARHMSSDSPQLLTVVSSLLHIIRTPSHSVQKAVSECLAPLMTHSILIAHAQEYIDQLMNMLSNGEDYGERKGAAFGLAGMINGLKLVALKRYGVLDRLMTMIQSKTSAKARQGALFAYERLFFELGAKFEPYVVSILPHLLSCFGDASPDVRQAAQECAKMIMSLLTGHGVRMVLPLILAALHEQEKKDRSIVGNKEASGASWRTKLESISLLGAMAYCAPQQLSTALPMIVPRLLEVMTDPNVKVQASAKTALKQIGSVIRNPEILALVPILLAALNDPSLNTKKALTELIRTSFVHSVDPPSLALIVPILKKGLRGRTAPTKKMAAQVVGSMCSLIGDIKDILPYAAALLKHVKELLVDPIPEVRSVAARALGSLYGGIRNHEVEGYAELLNDLLVRLQEDTTATERSGVAQGLAAVMSVEGVEKTRELLPDLFAETKNDKSVVREGYYNLFTSLPDAFHDEFAEFVPEVFPVIVEGLADETGLVREAALAAGQSLVVHYATTQTELLLPALETGLIAEDWRIRLSSVQLLGLMLLRIAGLNGKYLVGLHQQALLDDEDVKDATTVTTREQETEIETVLGTERRNRLFAMMYLMRSDVVTTVREMAWRVWKGLVTSTPRMLNITLPTLMNTVIFDLASSSAERQAAAGSALGELVVKLGENVLAQIIPILQSRLTSEDAHTRQGVCLGMAEVIKAARKADMAQYYDTVIPSIRSALCDTSPIVRAAAGKAFMILFKQIGRRPIEDIVPALIQELDELQQRDDQATALLVLGGIKEVLIIANEHVLPYLIPALTQNNTLSLFHTKALSVLADQLGKGFTKYVILVTNALIRSLATSIRKETEDQQKQRKEAAEKIVLCVTADSTQLFFETLTNSMAEAVDSSTKIACIILIACYCQQTKVWFDPHLPLLLQALITAWNDTDDAVVSIAWDAVETLCKVIPDDRLSRHIVFIRQVIGNVITNAAGVKQTTLPGLSVKKGLAPLLPAFQHALLHGTPTLRVEAADGLGDLISLSTEATLSSHVVKLTGPLIRILGDRFPSEVKAAIISTLDLLIVKTGKYLKPFLPQLQTTFIKSLQDPQSIVRNRAATALADLMTQSPRVETVLNELINTIHTYATNTTNVTNSNEQIDTVGIMASLFIAITRILQYKEIASKISAELRTKIQDLSVTSLSNEHESIRKASAHTLALILQYQSDDIILSTIRTLCLTMNMASKSWADRSGLLLALAFIARLLSTERLSYNVRSTIIIPVIVQLLSDDHVGVRMDAILVATEYLLLSGQQLTVNDMEMILLLLTHIKPALTDDLALIRQTAAQRLQFFAKTIQIDNPQTMVPILELTVPALLTRMTDSNGPVKKAAQAALYYLLGFHHGTDKAEKLINVFGSKLTKQASTPNAAGNTKQATGVSNNNATVNALLVTAKKTMLRLKPIDIRVKDELLGAESNDKMEDDEEQTGEEIKEEAHD